MIKREELISYLDELLNTGKYNDYAPNGLQVEGSSHIKRIATAVTASEEVILEAVKWQADALLVHHGYFWRGEAPVITGMKKQRIKHLLLNEINLLAYHLPLDCHLELGNNACLAKFFPLQSISAHKVGNIDNLLWAGVLDKPVEADSLTELIARKLNRTPLHVSAIKQPIRSIAWCSGGAQDYIEEAYKLGVDAYLSGEVSERTYYQAKELGIDYYACGHHATERFGIQTLGQHLANHYQLEHLYIDSDNSI
ncbi:Nif3-like dinuclear metal center hexameric protein [Legionella sp. km772]|uniref:Nif3-like dinuclear metal center hexameric protein n=1 Tax=Legionella sp. km772 TaxID=2498111 RepID=UPI000F8CBD7A|nr:Nif3-like dinuclear metal center hexameric protein [Legionella sp. km772]RUR08959.1 Nif3-like dinuclear metal center hexameric protein [Legionella sp. km772]